MATDQQIIKQLRHLGHFDRPFGQFRSVAWSDKLKLKDKEVRDAVQSYQDFMSVSAEPLIAKHHPDRRSSAILADGDVGPATRDLFDLPRCGAPDYGGEQRLIGSGGWKECHGGQGFHQVRVKLLNQPPQHVNAVWPQVWKRFADSYAEIGLEIKQVDSGQHEITFQFVGSSNGWIGLAIVGPGSCGRPIWARYLSTYRPRDVVNEWSVLLRHEVGHNVGMNHTRGGVMNPGIINGLPPTWKNDPAFPFLKNAFGGEPIPGFGDGEGERKLVVGFEYADGRFEKLYDLPQSGDDFWP